METFDWRSEPVKGKDNEVAAINEVTMAIEESNTALLEYQQTIMELSFERFDFLQDRISRITSETEFLVELMSNKKLYEDNGQFTDEGMASMGLHGVDYNTYMHQADMAGAEAERLAAEMLKDPGDTALLERYEKVVDLQREMILSAEDAKNSIRDLVEEGIELELSSLEELIDKYEEALSSEKDLYEYQKDVESQLEEISALEKQRMAYANDDSQESAMKKQQISQDLESAKEDLQETEFDRYIENTSKLLDDLYLEYEAILMSKLDSMSLLIGEITTAVNERSSEIKTTLETQAGAVGTSLSDSLSNIFSKETGENNVAGAITTYDENFGKTMTGVKDSIDGIKKYTDGLIAKADAEAKAKEEEAKKSNAANTPEASGKGNSSGSSSPSKPATTTQKSTSGGDGVPKVGDKVKFISGRYYYDSYGTSPAGSQHQGQYVYITHVNTKGSHPYHISTGSKLGNGDLGWLKLNQISGYASGKKNFLDDEVAWTQEDGREFIVRPSDGAILTPLAKGDSVLNAAASSNLWNMANSPVDFIKDNLGIGAVAASNGNNGTTSVTQNFENISFSFPNVKNYEQILAALQKDNNFERLVDSMTSDRYLGKNSLRKGKAIR